MSTKRSTAKAAMTTKGRKPGRPSDYSTELALEICAELVEGMVVWWDSRLELGARVQLSPWACRNMELLGGA